MKGSISNEKMKILTPLLTPHIENNNNSKLKNHKFHPVPTSFYKQYHLLVYDPKKEIESKGLKFSSNFESGSLGPVYQVGPKTYEIHLKPDPTQMYIALWYFFRVENFHPGTYKFIIVGFYRDAQLHGIGVQPTSLSMNDMKKGIGWKRFGSNMNFWCWKKVGNQNIYALSFTFSIETDDIIYFSYLYPYTYSNLIQFLSSIQITNFYSYLCNTLGGNKLPIIFWNSDEKKFIDINSINNYRFKLYQKKKPLIIIASRIHPGETNSSFAVEGFIQKLFDKSKESNYLLSSFSFLIIPMMNPDGVISGVYRPQLNGYDMNRIWKNPNEIEHPEVYNLIKVLDELTLSRKIVFLLDFHGHTAQCNSFTYSINNPKNNFNDYRFLFPQIMSKNCSHFDLKESINLELNEYPTTMRVALHHRYQIPFVYTLEMSFGGINIGTFSNQQYSIQNYKEVGINTAISLFEFMFLTPSNSKFSTF